jgi:hypothetical protein
VGLFYPFSPALSLANRGPTDLKYTLLEHKYSEAAGIQHWDSRLLGISLEQPTKYLNGEDGFTPPLSYSELAEENLPAAFMWQAPTSHAMLFLGDKWMELHDLVSRSMEVQDNTDTVPLLLSEKVTSKEQPSWLEHALRLCRLRGYWTHYPGVDAVKSLVKVHTELHHSPEEYSQVDQPIKLTDKASEQDIEKAMEQIRRGPEVSLDTESSLQNLIDTGVIQPFGRIPLIAWEGKITEITALDKAAAAYTVEFKTQVGKCDAASMDAKRNALSAEDLFCKAG